MIAVGSDPDIVVFDPDKQVRIGDRDPPSNHDRELHEGFEVLGWPVMTLRGEMIVEDGRVNANAVAAGCSRASGSRISATSRARASLA